MGYSLPFPEQCLAAGLQEPVLEFRFAPPRRFAFDFAWPEAKLALEQEGGLFGRGKKCPLCGRRGVAGHSSIERLKTDVEKYNTAATMGWRVLRCTPEQFASGEALGWVEKVLKE